MLSVLALPKVSTAAYSLGLMINLPRDLSMKVFGLHGIWVGGVDIDRHCQKRMVLVDNLGRHYRSCSTKASTKFKGGNITIS